VHLPGTLLGLRVEPDVASLAAEAGVRAVVEEDARLCDSWLAVRERLGDDAGVRVIDGLRALLAHRG
jgi:hypothetical protein